MSVLMRIKLSVRYFFTSGKSHHNFVRLDPDSKKTECGSRALVSICGYLTHLSDVAIVTEETLDDLLLAALRLNIKKQCKTVTEKLGSRFDPNIEFNRKEYGIGVCITVN